MNKRVLVEKLNLSYSFIEHMISKLSEKDMTESIVVGESTPKDLLAHIATWNWNGIEWIKSIAAGEKPILPMEGHTLEERDAIFAKLNEEVHKKNKNNSVKEVLDNHLKSWEELMKIVDTLTQDDLDREFHLDWAQN
ncbi:MAG: ClbS/DfsB family four-helix bundle protein, partial [Candidatus Thorarchaeota archaeon]